MKCYELIKIRKKLNLNVEQMAKLLNIDIAIYVGWEVGINAIPGTIKKLLSYIEKDNEYSNENQMECIQIDYNYRTIYTENEENNNYSAYDYYRVGINDVIKIEWISSESYDIWFKDKSMITIHNGNKAYWKPVERN